MNETDYVKLLEKIWAEFGNSQATPSDPHDRAVLAAAVLAEVAKDQRMNRISAERGTRREEKPDPMKQPMTQKQHDFLDRYGLAHEHNWTKAQASTAIDGQVAKWKGERE